MCRPRVISFWNCRASNTSRVHVTECTAGEYVEKSTWWDRAWLLSGAKKYPSASRGEVLPFEEPWTDAAMITFVKRMREIVLTTRAAEPNRRIG